MSYIGSPSPSNVLTYFIVLILSNTNNAPCYVPIMIDPLFEHLTKA